MGQARRAAGKIATGATNALCEPAVQQNAHAVVQGGTGDYQRLSGAHTSVSAAMSDATSVDGEDYEVRAGDMHGAALRCTPGWHPCAQPWQGLDKDLIRTTHAVVAFSTRVLWLPSTY